MIRRIMVATFALTALPMCAAAAAQPKFLPPLVIVRKLSPVEITGRSAADAVWSRPISIPRFTSLKGDTIPTQQNDVRFAYDDANLYLAFRCLDDDIDRLAVNYTKHDSFVWRDDSITLLFDTKNDQRSYYQLAANTAGVQYEEKDKSPAPKSWDGPWNVEAKKEAKAWTMLVTIPFESMGLSTPKVGTIWGANFCRKATVVGETNVWTPIWDILVNPSRWGKIVFGSVAAPIISASAPDVTSPGKHPLEVSYSNATGKPTRLKAEVTSDAKVVDTLRGTAAPGDTEWSTEFNMPDEGKRLISIAVYDGTTNQLLMRTPPAIAKIPSHRAKLDLYRQFVKGLTPPNDAAGKKRQETLRTLDGLSAEAKAALGSNEDWAKLTSKLDAVEKTVASLRYTCADKDGRGYVLGTETVLRKVFRDRLFEGDFDAPARISVARNEYEAVQVVAIALDKPLKNVAVSVTDLTGPGGAVIAGKDVALNVVGFVETRKPKYEIDYVGWYPDPLMDNRPFDVAVGEVQPVWVTVHPAKDAAAGVYTGKVIFKPEGALESSLPLEVRVWDFTLPQKPHMKTAFAYFPDQMGAWYRKTPFVQDDWYAFLLEHRINPTNIYTSTPLPEKSDVAFCAERGLNAFCLAYTHNKDEQGRAEMAAMIKDYETYLKSNGWWDMAYLYGFDEIRKEKYNEIKDMYGWVKQTFPDLPRMCTVVPNPELKGYVDIWVPVTSNWDQRDAEEYTKNGDQVWWYVCCNPHHPYPNFFTDYPAIDPRIIFWMNWKFKVPGFLYYAINIWDDNRKTRDRWPDVAWNPLTGLNVNGDGQLIYPGPDGKPLSSIRFDMIRDGIEDYEYFYILNDLVTKAEKNPKADRALVEKARKMLTVSDSIVASPCDYTLDPDLIMNARSDVAEMIERLGKL